MYLSTRTYACQVQTQVRFRHALGHEDRMLGSEIGSPSFGKPFKWVAMYTLAIKSSWIGYCWQRFGVLAMAFATRAT